MLQRWRIARRCYGVVAACSISIIYSLLTLLKLELEADGKFNQKAVQVYQI
jgi:NAD-dependent oxidoreductase involved in siderophore biosynthesis